ncbi:AaceriAFR726Wp [[Ashbya] aceris (nom. inval.)]|nr:AaceriAFR726Wp [[Ashbya] aceris (nom. inval.)]
MDWRDWMLVLVAIFMPPVTVGVKRGAWSKPFLASVVLYVVGFLPCLVHALYVVYQSSYDIELKPLRAGTGEAGYDATGVRARGLVRDPESVQRDL